MTSRNMNDLFSKLERNALGECRAAMDAPKTDMQKIGNNCAIQIGEYLNDKKIGVKPGWRGSVNLEYEDREDTSFSIGEDDLPLELKGGNSTILSLAFGKQLDLTNSMFPSGKLDLSLSYENVSDDPLRQDRTLAGATYTQGLAEGLQLTVGLVWANKAEYLPDSDDQLSARIGLNYKLSGWGKEEE